MFLIYGDSELKVNGYTDASFQTDKDDYKFQSGYIFLLNGGAIIWKSSKQSTIADSTTEAEYIAASEAAKEAVWMRKFIAELEVVPSIIDLILCIVTTMEPLHKQRNHGLINYPSMYSGVIISSGRK